MLRGWTAQEIAEADAFEAELFGNVQRTKSRLRRSTETGDEGYHDAGYAGRYGVAMPYPDLPLTTVEQAATGPLDLEPTQWDRRYGSRNVMGRSFVAFKALIRKQNKASDEAKIAPDLKAAHEWVGPGGQKGTRLRRWALNLEEYQRVMLPPRGAVGYVSDPARRAAVSSAIDSNWTHINGAFAAMQLDTVEAQAAFLAHAFAESGQLTELEERGASSRRYAPFIGRGPLQTTWRSGYMRALAYLEVQAERLLQLNARPSAELAARAVKAIKGDIRAAANPHHGALFAAAYMHCIHGVELAARLAGQNPQFPGNGPEDMWMTGGVHIATKLARARAKLAQATTPAATAAAQRAVRDWESATRGARLKKAAYARVVALQRPTMP